jgi:hypothetical protein
MPISPLLPDELWVKVFNSFGTDYEDFPRLWMQSRHICRASRYSIEQYFWEEVIPNISISIGIYKPQSCPFASANYTDKHLRTERQVHKWIHPSIAEDPNGEIGYNALGTPAFFQHKCFAIRAKSKTYAPMYDIRITRAWGRSPFTISPTYSRFLIVRYAESTELAIKWNWRHLLTLFLGEQIATYKNPGISLIGKDTSLNLRHRSRTEVEEANIRSSHKKLDFRARLTPLPFHDSETSDFHDFGLSMSYHSEG